MTSERPPIQPLKRAFSPTWHTPEQLDRLKQATLDILETVGVKFPSQRALEILAAHGCTVDRETQVVRFPPQLVFDAMATAPRYFDLGARDPECDLRIADDTTYCTTDGCGTEVVDWQTRERRMSTKADLARISRLQDYLASISFWWPTTARPRSCTRSTPAGTTPSSTSRAWSTAPARRAARSRWRR
jgi:trimethylamine:corrinoid methyltransferase-like protein